MRRVGRRRAERGAARRRVALPLSVHNGRGTFRIFVSHTVTVTVHDSSSASDARSLSQDVPRSSDHRIQPHQVLGPFACGVDAPQPGATRPQRLRGLRGSRKLVRVAIDGHEGCMPSGGLLRRSSVEGGGCPIVGYCIFGRTGRRQQGSWKMWSPVRPPCSIFKQGDSELLSLTMLQECG
jgi:hypothetical protein